MVNVPTPWPLTATRTSLPTDTVRVPWTTGAGDEAGAEDEDEEDDAGDEAGAVADEEDPDDDEPGDDEPGAEVAEREVPGAAWEPGPVARTAGTVAPPGLTDGAGPLRPAPGVWPAPCDGPPRELPTTPGPALPRAPAPGALDGGAPPPMISTALTAAAAAAVAALAVRAWECRRTRCQPGTPGGRLGAGNPDGPNWPARSATLARRASPAAEESAHVLSTCSRNPGSSATSGSAPANRAGVSSRRLSSPQVWHWSMCLLIRLRIRAVSWPSHPVNSASSAVQSSRPVRATSSAPRDRSSWLRARDTSACAWLRDTPSVSASSSASRPCTRLSSITSRSLGFSPAIASRTNCRTSACSTALATSTASAVTSPASSSADVVSPARSLR